MHDEPTPDDAPLSGLEARLAALVPRAAIDRDRLMFAAGQRAAAHRLRTANRLLTASSLVLGCLVVALVAVPRERNVPIAGSEPRAAVVQNTAGNDRATDGLAADSSAADAGTDTVVAALDPAANFRLLQLLENDPAAILDEVPRQSPPAGRSVEPIQPSYPRALLNRYLERASDQM